MTLYITTCIPLIVLVYACPRGVGVGWRRGIKIRSDEGNGEILPIMEPTADDIYRSDPGIKRPLAITFSQFRSEILGQTLPRHSDKRTEYGKWIRDVNQSC